MPDNKIPDFSLPATGGEFRLSAHLGRPLVIYFYPKDNTPGCTTEAGQFRDLHAAFAKLGCAVFGISRDSLKSHDGFKAKLGLPFDLISDPDETACALFDVIRMKKLYGKDVRGIERSTFLIDATGRLAREWRGVKVPDHAAEVLRAVAEL
ncbi:MAG TPA: peroxiredoxin [Rhodocyclaceae bacterium]|nr:peroxiredoxin [Rhodocyclaceae bacterium]